MPTARLDAKIPAPGFVLALLIALCFTLATSLQLRTEQWSTHKDADGVLKILLGDGRRIFANHFYIKADVYFHSGYYPSIFDQGAAAKASTDHHILESDHDHDHADHDHGLGRHEDEKSADLLGQPRDWVDKFGRNFYSSKHSHLDAPGDAKEIMPWLRISADLDPERIETYTAAAYWLRDKLHKVDEAEQFLREGLRANPNSYEIRFELGRIYYRDHHDLIRARNLWELGLKNYQDQMKRYMAAVRADEEKSKANANGAKVVSSNSEPAPLKPDIFVLQELTTNLALLEEEQGDLPKALYYREMEVNAAPEPEIPVVQKQIEELKQKLAAQKNAPGK